jgi:hypothetical protein
LTFEWKSLFNTTHTFEKIIQFQIIQTLFQYFNALIWLKYDFMLRDYYITFSIFALVSAWDSHIKHDSEAGGLIWVEGWYQGQYGKFHVIIYLSHISHWFFSSIDFYIAEKIFELINCKNKFLRELPLFNLQIFLFRVWFQKDIKQCWSVQLGQKVLVKSTQDVDIWMEISIQHDIYIWANYSVSSYLNLIPIFWNVLNWLKYDFMYIFMHHLSLSCTDKRLLYMLYTICPAQIKDCYTCYILFVLHRY